MKNGNLLKSRFSSLEYFRIEEMNFYSLKLHNQVYKSFVRCSGVSAFMHITYCLREVGRTGFLALGSSAGGGSVPTFDRKIHVIRSFLA